MRILFCCDSEKVILVKKNIFSLLNKILFLKQEIIF